MLRVNRFDEPYSVRLRLDGQLLSGEVGNVELVWREAVSVAQGRKLVLDVSGVTQVDDAGADFLKRLHAAGISIDDDGHYFPRPCVQRPCPFTERLRRRLCAALCALVPSFHRCPCGQHS